MLTKLLLEFAAAVVVTWVAGVWVARSTDAIDTHFNLGGAFGGLLLLGISGSLPEIAITVTAALHHDTGVVIGNLLGGVAIQTLVLVIFDWKLGRKKTLSYSAASLTLVLEAAAVILVTVLAILGMRTPTAIHGTSLSIVSLLILATWLFSLWLIYRARTGLPWKAEAIGAEPGRAHHERRAVINHDAFKDRPASFAMAIFALTSIVTLIAGVVLEVSGTGIAAHFNIASGLFAATVIAGATALPEISSGLASVNLGDYQLAFSDIFGGNAFMPALFIMADILAGRQVLAGGTTGDVWFAALGILLTAVYIIGLIVRPRKTYFGLGPDSLAVLLIYVGAIVSLAYSTGH